MYFLLDGFPSTFEPLSGFNKNKMEMKSPYGSEVDRVQFLKETREIISGYRQNRNKTKCS